VKTIILLLLFATTIYAGTFGILTEGAGGGYGAQYLRAYGDSAITGADADGAILDTIAVYCRATVSGVRAKFALFTDNSGPDTKVCESDSLDITQSGSPSWHYFTNFTSHSLNASTRYWFAILSNNATGENILTYYSAPSYDQDAEIDTDVDYTVWPNIPSSWATTDVTEDRSYSVYGIYHTAGGPLFIKVRK
jgi:hypothetical protein